MKTSILQQCWQSFPETNHLPTYLTLVLGQRTRIDGDLLRIVLNTLCLEAGPQFVVHTIHTSSREKMNGRPPYKSMIHSCMN